MYPILAEEMEQRARKRREKKSGEKLRFIEFVMNG